MKKKDDFCRESNHFLKSVCLALMLDQFWRLCGVRRYLADGTNHVDSPYE